METPINTLFLLQSLDWKITPWNSDSLDIWKDLSKIKWLKDWLMQYYKLEQETDLHSLNTGRVMAKIWMNDKNYNFEIYPEVSFIIVDNSHLNEIWVEKMASKLKKLYIVTKNKNHPAFKIKQKFDNIEILFYEDEIDFIDMMRNLKSLYSIDKITIQSWWTMNSIFFRNNLIHKISIVIAPVIIWWKDTTSLVDWESLTSVDELYKLKVLNLKRVENLWNSYLHLEYDVLRNTEIESWFIVPN